MGFDLSGLNPESSTPQPTWTKGEPFVKVEGKDNHYEVDPQLKEEYDAYMKSRWEWQDATEGAYFRNNVWGWRPLWSYVCSVCYDILSDKDASAGSFNDGHKISKTKAGKIAKKLHSLIKDGKVKEYENGYKKHIASLEQVDCDLCETTGRRKEPPKTGAGDYMECNKCSGTGKVDDWAKSYPFSEDNVRQFANFCANSGGFTIC